MAAVAAAAAPLAHFRATVFNAFALKRPDVCFFRSRCAGSFFCLSILRLEKKNQVFPHTSPVFDYYCSAVDLFLFLRDFFFWCMGDDWLALVSNPHGWRFCNCRQLCACSGKIHEKINSKTPEIFGRTALRW